MNKNSKTIFDGSVFAGVIASVITLLIGCFCATWLIQQQTVDMKELGYLVMGILFLTGLVGGITTVVKAKQKVLIMGCILSVVVFLVLICVGALFFEGAFVGIGQTLLLLIGVIVSTILVGTHRKERVKPGRRRIRTG